MKFERVQHVSVPRMAGEEARWRALEFYGGVLGFEPVPKPRSLSSLDISWFRQGDQEVHVYATAGGEAAPESGAHFCLTVDDIAAARSHLENAGYACEDTIPIPQRPRFFTRDPFGNLIEVTRIEGEYDAEE